MRFGCKSEAQKGMTTRSLQAHKLTSTINVYQTMFLEIEDERQMPGYNQPAKTTNTRTIGTKKNKHRLSLASQWQVKPPRCLACESTRSWCLSHSPSFTRSSKPTPFQNVFRKLELFQVMRCKNERSELTSS